MIMNYLVSNLINLNRHWPPGQCHSTGYVALINTFNPLREVLKRKKEKERVEEAREVQPQSTSYSLVWNAFVYCSKWFCLFKLWIMQNNNLSHKNCLPSPDNQNYNRSITDSAISTGIRIVPRTVQTIIAPSTPCIFGLIAGPWCPLFCYHFWNLDGKAWRRETRYQSWDEPFKLQNMHSNVKKKLSS